MARKAKVAYEIKAQIVRQVLDENLSLAEAAKNAGGKCDGSKGLDSHLSK